MKLPRDLSSAKLVKLLCLHWGYVQVHQSGSHVILQTEEPFHQRIAIPAHKNLRLGTLNNILRAVAIHKGISRDDLLATL